MRILIVEDERPTAEDIRDLTKELLGDRVSSIHIQSSLHNALDFLSTHAIDVLLLDLNLNERNGFEILKQAAARSFHTIIISAYSDKAVEAFEFGVLDFIPKPYNLERLQTAFNRLQDSFALDTRALKYLSVRKFGSIHIVPLKNVKYFKGANVYTELHLTGGTVEIYDKSLKSVKKLLPRSYARIHKSYIVDIRRIRKIFNFGGGRYEIELEDRDRLPVSRSRIREIRKQLDLAEKEE
jgi:two-component system response regulator LytT